MPPEWGYPGPKIRAAIERLDGPGRRYDPRPLTEPPFYILEAAPAITYTLGGLLIDPDARVRARGGGVVPGLLAAGADAGG
jgi:succinate dehydrogenase/fumarate reductase flavoprotein subunit